MMKILVGQLSSTNKKTKLLRKLCKEISEEVNQKQHGQLDEFLTNNTNGVMKCDTNMKFYNSIKSDHKAFIMKIETQRRNANLNSINLSSTKSLAWVKQIYRKAF